MANKKAPYKDPSIIAQLKRFNQEYKIPVKKDGQFTADIYNDGYLNYLKWIVQSNDPILLASTLNKPQFDKAWEVVCLMIWGDK